MSHRFALIRIESDLAKVLQGRMNIVIEMDVDGRRSLEIRPDVNYGQTRMGSV